MNEMKDKIIVLDTNVLIHNPRSIFSFEDAHIVIPITVIEEIDNFKKGLDEKSRNARQVSRYLDELGRGKSLSKGVSLKEVGENLGTLQVSVSHKITEGLNDVLIMDENDNLIIGTALYFKKENPDKEIILVSKDANVRIKANAVGLRSENFEMDKVNFQELYTGEQSITVSQNKIDELLSNGILENEFGLEFPHQFLILKSADIGKEVIARYSKKSDRIYPLQYYKGKPVWGILPRNIEQTISFELLLDDDIKIVSLVGIAGTGKTLLALAAGLQKVIQEEKYNRLVISRPIFPLGKDIGYLPGTKQEKFNPWMQPIYDNMDILLMSHHQEKVEKAKGNGIRLKKRPSLEDFLSYGFIELEPLTYIRGRSLPAQFMIIDEAQNLTPHEMKTIITRAGENTKIVLTGDPYQIDIPYLDSETNGLSIVAEKFKQEEIAGHLTLVKGERSELAELAAKYL